MKTVNQLDNTPYPISKICEDPSSKTGIRKAAPG
jgi:hypothetical protein